MMKSVLTSIKPQYCELIANGKKTVELRKTRPKLDVPFKSYIYCTKPKKYYSYATYLYTSNEFLHLYHGKIKMSDGFEFMCVDDYEACQTLNGKVIGEFVCDQIFPISVYQSDLNNRIALMETSHICLTDKQIINYLGNGKQGYGWHISDLKIYEKPIGLDNFQKPFDKYICPRGEQKENCVGCWD